jgi:hypothetical protein
MRKITLSTLFFFLTTVILAVVLLVHNTGAEKERGYDSSTVMSRISYLQELALVKHNYTGVIGYRDYMKILNINVPLTEKYFLLKYNGYIKAGVDFNRIKVNVENDSTVHVSIPQPRILDTVIDEKSVEVYNEALAREKDVMIRDAIAQGIYTDATDEAKIAITSLLKDMGFKDIRITEEFTMPQVQ